MSDAGSNVKELRGFARLPRDVLSEIGRKGGIAAHQAGTAHEYTSEEARAAGRKGGKAKHKNRAPQTAAPDTGDVA